MKLSVVGTGAMAREILPYLAGWGWEVEGICSTKQSADIARELAERYDIPSIYTDYTKFLADDTADTVYLAVPNHLHAPMAEQALLAGKHLIVEKPFAGNQWEAERLSTLAMEKKLFLYEAVSTPYLPNYEVLSALLPQIGTVKLVTCNYSQYSRRYDAFRAGELPSVFDPAQCGGALMDLNVYNIHWLLGLFGCPNKVEYHPNIERGIDTNGVILLDYGEFQAVSIAAKDCTSVARYLIQGSDGYLMLNTPANICGEVLLHKNDGSEERFYTATDHRLEKAFRAFQKQIAIKDHAACYTMLERSLQVSKVMTKARISAGLCFPSDPREVVKSDL